MALPEVVERLSHGEPTWFIQGKRSFAMFADRHHDDRVAVWCAAPAGAQEAMIASDPLKYFRPPYVGPRGWLGVYLDVLVEWDDLASVLSEAYLTVAPPKLRRTYEDSSRDFSHMASPMHPLPKNAGGGGPQTLQPPTKHSIEAFPNASLAMVSFMAGHWIGKDGEDEMEEFWTVASAGTMLGTFRWNRAGSPRFYELCLLREEGNQVAMLLRHFGQDFDAWEDKKKPMRMMLVEAGNGRAVFLEQGNENMVWLIYELAEEGLSIRFEAQIGDPPIAKPLLLRPH